MTDLTYQQIRDENFSRIIHGDNTDEHPAQRAHAIAMRRLSNCPGFWESEADKSEATRLIIGDIERDAKDHGWQDRLEEWATKKLIELAIKILIAYLESHYHEQYAVPGAMEARATFGSDMQTWATQAEQSLSD